jgi:hypothetical protein
MIDKGKILVSRHIGFNKLQFFKSFCGFPYEINIVNLILFEIFALLGCYAALTGS